MGKNFISYSYFKITLRLTINCSIGIASDYWLHDRRIGVRFQIEDSYISFWVVSIPDFGAHPAAMQLAPGLFSRVQKDGI